MSDQKIEKFSLSVVVPCYNEAKTLEKCINRLLEIRNDIPSLDIIIVDDCSTDTSLAIARKLSEQHSEIRVFHHERNRGKGAALRTGFKYALGDFVAIQDADLEYDPNDLKRLLIPLVEGDADVVLGSRFASGEVRRVLFFWHSLGNKFLTFVSNMFTDLNLTDMETCYKVFRREVIQSIELEEDRFGFEPEIVAKIARMNLRIYETGISYYGRTYAEGKKIGVRDGIRALYCIFKFNAYSLPLPVQFLAYLAIAGHAALANLVAFMTLLAVGCGLTASTILAFILAAALNYFLCIALIFKHKAYWNSLYEVLVYSLVVFVAGSMDYYSTILLIGFGYSPFWSKAITNVLAVIVNFLGRRWLVFPLAERKKKLQAGQELA